jgi:hypothetical protein
VAFCHGKGGADQDGTHPNGDGGCCYVNGAVCPNRLKQVDGRVYDHTGADLGTTTQYINSLTNNGAARRRAADQVQGIVFGCVAAIRAIVANASIVTDRAVFDAAWAARLEYQAVADAWEALGLPRDYCQVYGMPQGQCCFSEDTVTNEARAADLSEVAVTLRRAGGS